MTIDARRNLPRFAYPSGQTAAERLAWVGWDVDDGEDPCWRWRGRLDRYGYSLFSPPGGSTKHAYRVVYEITFAPIPAGETVHHRCSQRDCVNPAHLQLASRRANVAEMHTRQAMTKRIAALETENAILRARLGL